MPNKFLSLMAFTVLIACAATPEVPPLQTLPLKTFLKEISNRPYECYEYKGKTDSCQAIAKRTVKGTTMTMDVEMLHFLRGGGSVTAYIVADFELGKTAFCGDLSEAAIRIEGGVVPAPIRDQIADDLKRRLAKDGTSCSEYARDAQGQYYTLTRDASGQIKGSVDRVWFFADRKRLSG